MTLTNVYTDSSTVPLRERLTSVRWETSRDGSKEVPVVELPACRPDLICQKLQYDDCHGKDCQKFSPGQAPVNDTVLPVIRPDPFPLCNPVPEESEDTGLLTDKTDCQARPCTCHHMDYTLWSRHQWGEDCSYQLWAPQCSVSGLYGPVQYKVNPYQDNSHSRWCSSPAGQRIFGQEKVSLDQSLMTCSCSRKRWELEQETGEREARRDVSLHCTEAGGWESLQCDKELCWCVNTVSGAAISNVVPESLITLLPCYPHTDTETVFGSQ